MIYALSIVHSIGSIVLAVALVWAIRTIQGLAAQIRRDVASLSGNVKMRHAVTVASEEPPTVTDVTSMFKAPAGVRIHQIRGRAESGQIPTDYPYDPRD